MTDKTEKKISHQSKTIPVMVKYIEKKRYQALIRALVSMNSIEIKDPKG